MFASQSRPAGRLRSWMIAALAVAAVTAGMAAPANAQPSPQQVEQQIDKQWNQLEPVIENFNHVHAQLLANRAQQKQLSARLQPLQKRIDTALSSVGTMAGQAYMQGGYPGMTGLLITGGATDLTDKLTYLDIMSRSRRAQVAGVITLRDSYAATKHQLDAVTASLATRDAELASQKNTIQSRINDLQKLRTQAYGASGAATGKLRTGPCPAAYTSDAGGRAAAKACSLIGKPYIWADAGPDGYDCSGLAIAAWAVNGVKLRHYTKWQWDDAKAVSRADLEPGDLVFWFSDLHHMGIYVGAGTVVHAPHTGDFVRMAGIDDIGPIAGYRRPS